MEQVDKFIIEAVDLGDLEKLVVAKGPGKPWLLEKILVKKGEFAPEEHVFLFGGYVKSVHKWVSSDIFTRLHVLFLQSMMCLVILNYFVSICHEE